MKKIWITTDTHFGHDKLVEYSGRPENHSTIILQELHKNLKEGDTLIHLGDICIGNDETWHHLLTELPKGKRILVKGNHDNKSNNWYLNHGWDMVCEQFSDHYFGKYITFSHKPIPHIQNLNIHGHFHNNLHKLLRKECVTPDEEKRNMVALDGMNANHKLLAIENTKYRPVLLESFVNK